jgi:hypothetical protein
MRDARLELRATLHGAGDAAILSSDSSRHRALRPPPEQVGAVDETISLTQIVPFVPYISRRGNSESQTSKLAISVATTLLANSTEALMRVSTSMTSPCFGWHSIVRLSNMQLGHRGATPGGPEERHKRRPGSWAQCRAVDLRLACRRTRGSDGTIRARG